jgi:orotate phosphoribosyltransferase
MNFAKILLERKLLLIGNFILTSGKTSPYYLDLRKLPSFPEFKEIVDMCVKIISKLEFDIIVGIATGGVILASYLACKLNKPVGYVRVEKKGHGLDKLVEAEVKNRKVLVVDDVSTTGGSIEKAALEIAKEGGNVIGALVIVDRQEGAEERLSKLGIKLYSLFKISELLKDLLNSQLLNDEEKKIIIDYIGGKVEI